MKSTPVCEGPKYYYPGDDARTIIRAQEVLGDPKRRAGAVAELKKQAAAANAAVAHASAVKDIGKQLKAVFGGK